MKPSENYTEEDYMTWLASHEKNVDRAATKWRMWRRNSRPMSLPTDEETEDFKRRYAERISPLPEAQKNHVT